MKVKKGYVQSKCTHVHLMTMVSILLCIAALVSLLIMVEPELFNNPFFLGMLPFLGFIFCPLLAIVAGIIALVRPQPSYGKVLAQVSILVGSLLMLTALILLYYATQFS